MDIGTGSGILAMSAARSVWLVFNFFNLLLFSLAVFAVNFAVWCAFRGGAIVQACEMNEALFFVANQVGTPLIFMIIILNSFVY